MRLGVDAWRSAWQALGGRVDDTLHTALLARYAEAHRAYHTLQHLSECLALFEDVRALAERPAEIEVALWFHDAIYDVHRHDNEARSAAWARSALQEAGADSAVAQRLQALVLATRHSVAPRTRDEQLLVDIDLAILGARPARFTEYEAQIRQEYVHVPLPLFADKRAAILQGFLARSAIYGTPVLAARFEIQARTNLQQALVRLA